MFTFHIYFWIAYEPVLQRWSVDAEGQVFAELAFWQWAAKEYGMRATFIKIDTVEVEQPPQYPLHPHDPSNEDDTPF